MFKMDNGEKPSHRSHRVYQVGGQSDQQENIDKIVQFFFYLQLSNKLNHWHTTSFARHKATDQFDDVLNDLMDKFLEVFMGRYQVKPNIDNIKLDSRYLSNDNMVALFKDARTLLEKFGNYISDTDLLNIRDELLAEVNKMLYLFTLN